MASDVTRGVDDARPGADAAVPARVGVLGLGRLGSALARRLGEVGVDVAAASSTDDPAAACAADAVILAVPLGRYRDLPRDLLRGRLVIDAMNYWWELDAGRPELDDPTTSTSETVAAFLDGARVVKALGHVSVWELENQARPPGDPERRGIAIAGDDAEDVATVAALVDRLGFDPVTAGALAEGVRFEPNTEIFGSDSTAAEIRVMLDRFPRSQRGRVIARARATS